ncbi:DUF1318 domain-containing protein [candidate division KSB1 bacterium]|nr:DUF1318 domain-containing protein [candidate division KSB1 bacterium]
MKWFSLIILLFMFNCGIQAPQLSVTGEKTALEKQVLGDYEKIESDSWFIASERSFNEFRTQSDNEAIFTAMHQRKARKTELDDLRRDKVIGENNRGFLEVLPTEAYEENEDYRRRVDELVQAENRDRKRLFERIIEINQWQDDEVSYYQQFARPQQKSVAAGTMIQDPQGHWTEKAKQEKETDQL